MSKIKHRAKAQWHDTPVPTLNLAWANATDRERLDFIKSHSPDIRIIIKDIQGEYGSRLRAGMQ